jgi:hypothetical protein
MRGIKAIDDGADQIRGERGRHGYAQTATATDRLRQTRSRCRRNASRACDLALHSDRRTPSGSGRFLPVLQTTDA